MTITSEFHFPVTAFEILVLAMLYFMGEKMAYISGKNQCMCITNAEKQIKVSLLNNDTLICFLPHFTSKCPTFNPFFSC